MVLDRQMVQKSLLIAGALVALAACDPGPPPDQGVGFGSLSDLEPIPPEGRRTDLGGFVSGGRISDESAVRLQGATPTQALEPVDDFEQLAEQAINQAETGNGGSTRQPASPGGNSGISDEQDFDAVASRESIESDRERLAAQREAYQVIEPGALPTRRGGAGASVVEFALATSHAPGVEMYSRLALSGQARFDRNCAKYASQDQAQSAFLAAGGPERDRYGIDPDGDGYACFWDPRPFRLAVSN